MRAVLAIARKELERAALSVQLGKKYAQEEQLRWGYLSDRKMST